jgi:hypothetical protein
MKAAFIVMSILGCDDSGTVCAPVAQVPQQWQTISACDAASEKQLLRYTKVNHPVIVAVCQTAGTNALADSTDDVGDVELANRYVATMPQDEHSRGITARALELVKTVIPTKKALSETATYPVHVVTDTYSWLARKIGD